MRIPVMILGLCLACAASAAGPIRSLKIRGYVTEVHSPLSFQIDDYRIMRDQSLEIEIEAEGEDEDALLEPGQGIRIGTEIEIKGDFNAETGELKAKSIKVFPSNTSKLKRTALLDNPPDLRKNGAAWTGCLRVDGQTLLVDERTLVTIVPNQSQQKAQKQAKKEAEKARKQDPATNPAETAPAVPLEAPELLHPNMYVAYEGRRLEDGRVQATKIEFKDNELTPGEAKLWESLTPTTSGFKEGKPGELKIANVGKFKTTANLALQSYVQALGASLIPASQRNLPGNDPERIPFQFHVVEAKYANAFATPNGVIVVHAPLLRDVENEAQLAFVLSHEIAHATQEHSIRQMEFHKKKRLIASIAAVAASAYGWYSVSDMINLTLIAIASGYSRYLENQADRVGMEYMIAAGYDPREAPRAWKAIALKHGDAPVDLFWSSHDNHTTRRSYLMAELRNNYSGQDFSALKTNGDTFQRLNGTLRMGAEQGKTKVKVTK